LLDSGALKFRTATSSRNSKEELRSVLVGSTKVVLDFANVDYLSSAALGVLIVFDKRAKATSCRVHMCNLKPDIPENFQITKLDRLFTIYNDRTSALGASESLSGTDSGADAKLN